MLQTDDNPGGVPIDVFDGLRAGALADRAQLYRDLADGPFFGDNREGTDVSQGMRDEFWRQGMQVGRTATPTSASRRLARPRRSAQESW